VQPGKPDEADPQYATYDSNHKVEPWHDEPADSKDSRITRGWTPLPLQTYFWVPLVTFMALLAIGLEIALHFSNKQKGWRTFSAFTTDSGFMHFVYTLPPVIIAMSIVTLWAWTDIEFKKMQPYIDLVHGDSPPQRSLLLDYTRTSNFVVWILAFWNRHYMVAFATLLVLLGLVFQPLAAAMFTIRDTYLPHPIANVTNLGLVGLNQDANFQDLTSFLSAAGYASSSVLYNLGDPPFLHDVYTVAPFKIPTDVASNGTVSANTTAVKTDPNCHLATTVSTSVFSGTGWQNNVTFNGCTFSYTVNKSTPHLFGSDIFDNCISNTPVWFQPIVLWFFTYDTSPPQGSATYCAPAISLYEVAVEVDIATGNLTSVQEIRPFSANSTSPFESLSGNITGDPLNGRAYNGIQFNLTGADQFVVARQNATNLQLPSSILQKALASPGGLTSAFTTNSFTGMAVQVYTTYLKLIAKSVYFLPTTDETIPVQVNSVQKRLWLSAVAVHILVVALLVVAFIGTYLHLMHRHSRKDLHLLHEPGTIASAVSISAQTDLANLLHGRQQEDDFVRTLRDKKFRIDPRTMKIVMQGEAGYESAASPNPRQSIFGSLGFPRRTPQAPTS